MAKRYIAVKQIRQDRTLVGRCLDPLLFEVSKNFNQFGRPKQISVCVPSDVFLKDTLCIFGYFVSPSREDVPAQQRQHRMSRREADQLPPLERLPKQEPESIAVLRGERSSSCQEDNVTFGTGVCSAHPACAFLRSMCDNLAVFAPHACRGHQRLHIMLFEP